MLSLPTHVGRFVRAVIEILRLAVARDRLPEPPSGTSVPSPSTQRGRVRAGLSELFAHEELPIDPEVPRPPRRSAAVLGREVLGLDPEVRWPPRPGLLRKLFGPEPFPGDLPPEPHSPRRSRWLAWLFAPERLDPP